MSEWLEDLIKEWVQAQSYLTTSYVDRGDPATNDYGMGDFTRDGAWHMLDLSAIVPAGAVAVHLTGSFAAIGVQASIEFRKHGNVNLWNKCLQYIYVSWFTTAFEFVCALDSQRRIDYRFWTQEMGNYQATDMTVKGWWL